MTIKFNKRSTPEFVERLYKRVDEAWNSEVYGSDYHNELFNREYLYNGQDEAEKVLMAFNYYSIFKQINLIVEYEKFNFGEVTTIISEADRVAEMLSYIFGEALLRAVGSKTLNDRWDDKLTEKYCKKFITTLRDLLKTTRIGGKMSKITFKSIKSTALECGAQLEPIRRASGYYQIVCHRTAYNCKNNAHMRDLATILNFRAALIEKFGREKLLKSDDVRLIYGLRELILGSDAKYKKVLNFDGIKWRVKND